MSTASLDEIGQKALLGRLDLAHADGASLPGWSLRWLSLDERTMARSALAEWTHSDPFDRMNLSAVEMRSLPLITSDARFFEGDCPFDVRLVA